MADEEIGADFFRGRLQNAIHHRSRIGFSGPLRRLVHAESDLIPGLIVDQYGKVLVIQLLSAGVEAWRETLIQILADELQPESIYERSDVDVRRLEGLSPQAGLLSGKELEEVHRISEPGLETLVDIRTGHKTGSYLDQRENRRLVGGLCRGKEVLDCFCYSGGFAIQALINNAASITLLDQSPDALELAKLNFQANQLNLENVEFDAGDVFSQLRLYRDQARSFDVIILDPPKFAPTAAHASRAARGYKDINLMALKLLRPGGLLATYSCSGGISRDFFLRVLSGAALDAEVNARIELHMGQSADHSINLSFPEGNYLKGFGVRVDG